MNKIEMAATINLSLPLLSLCKPPKFLKPPTTRFLQHEYVNSLSLSLRRRITESNTCRKRRGIVCGLPLPVDPWAPTIDSQSIASQLFAFSLFPYIGFLYFITKSKTAPNLTIFGFSFWLPLLEPLVTLSISLLHLFLSLALTYKRCWFSVFWTLYN